ncbi:hypothetical protein [Bifidobacterium samirii]|uniref:Uncharacterized protein n=1 Tax=Bifidobacterium samirii TaxID=2306974 RepID=A0A430FF11_9BIFI|nr:hypothetical protein [Bifidobacterium samirii]RSX51332.1 hypothetical protein D2E24_1895 [Bifidobacterium samirii]
MTGSTGDPWERLLLIVLAIGVPLMLLAVAVPLLIWHIAIPFVKFLAVVLYCLAA